jgi:prolipoprotein diacylglyceryl transferase
VTLTVLAYLPSPDQGVWHLGPFPIRAYALCILAGIVAALIIGDRRWSARGGEPGVIYDIALWAVPFGLIGGRLYHVLTDWSTYFGDGGKGFGAALRIWDGGLGIWGAVALGGVGAWIGCRRRGIPLPAFGDAIAPGIILAQAIGRLGNYFNQELYGRPTTVPWGLEVYERRNAAGYPDSLNGVSTGQLVDVFHPTFLYELLWNLLVFGLLLLIDKRFRIGHGRLFALYVAGYCLGRFWIELMRSDYATTIGDTGIRINTFTSTFVFIAAVVYVMVATKGREEPWTLRGKDAVAGGESVVDDAAENVTAAAATSGLVAAAVVAGKEDDPAASGAGDDVAVDDFDGKKSEAAAEAEDLVEQVETASSEDIAEAEAFAEAGEEADDAAEDEFDGKKSEAAAEAEDLVEQVETASSEDIAEAEAFAEAGEEADDADKPEAGLGSVDGDEVVAAEGDAAEVQEAAAEGAFEAETLAADLGADADAVASTDDPADDAEALVEDVPAEADSAAPEEGLGSVDGDEVTAAKGDAAEVHAAAVTGADDAETLADGVRDESEPSDVTSTEAAPEEGLGSVDGDEVTAAEGVADEVHAAAVVGADEAESLADDVAAETPEPAASSNDDDPESSAAPEEGLGSVDGDEVTAAKGDADEVHAAAVVGADEAESLADDVAVEDVPEPAASSSVDDPESSAAPEEGLGSVDGDEVSAAKGDADEVHEAAVVGADKAESLADDVAADDVPEPAASSSVDDPESSAAPEEGLGSVDGDEVTAAEGDADEVHEAAVVGADEAESLADDVAGEDVPGAAASSIVDDPESSAAPEEGLGSVDGDEVTAAEGDAEKVHDAAVAGEEDAKALPGDTTTPAASAAPTTGRTRRRWWQRNRG